ncbi:MAG: hypothetical protein P8M80_08245 [Pirellulaceae bacterium]|nr:hypothetical protein [Pirellulaceae bacterium]
MKIPKTTLFFVLIPFATVTAAMLYLEMGPELGSRGQQALSGEVGSHPPRSKTTVLAVPHRFGEVIGPLLPEKPAPKGASIPAEEHSDRSRTIQAMAISPRPVELAEMAKSKPPARATGAGDSFSTTVFPRFVDFSLGVIKIGRSVSLH